MNLNSLSVGNIVSLAYNLEVITTVIAIEYGGAVQVACNNYADDIRDITGIPLNEKILKRFHIPIKIINDKAAVYISCRDDEVFVSPAARNNLIQIAYIHQLQNIVSFFTGTDIIDYKKFRI